jgi:cold shock protein
MAQTGKVKFYNESKGFGFIVPDAGGPDVFVHATGLIDQVGENDIVSFDVVEGRKGLSATNVKKA